MRSFRSSAMATDGRANATSSNSIIANGPARDVFKLLVARRASQGIKRASTPPSKILIKMISSMIVGLLVSAVLVVADASPPQAGTTGGTGILTPPRLRFSPPTSRRRRASPLQVLLSASRRTSRRHRGDDRSIGSEFIDSRVIQFAGAKKTTTRPSNDEVASANGSGSGFWPPWPFNHLKSSGRPAGGTEEDTGQGSGGGLDYKKDAKLLWRYISHRARVGARQIQQLSSDLSFHLPPAAPPLLLIALLPSRQAASDAVAKASGAIVRKSSFARRVSLTSLGVAIVSWAHYEIRQQKRLVPLPLREEYRDYKKALLPPFLPEALPPLEDSSAGLAAVDEKMEAAETGEEFAQRRAKLRKETGTDDALLSDDVRSRIKRELEYLYRAAPKPDTVVPTLQELLKKRMARARREEDIRRKAVVEELLALQALKKISRKKNGGSKQNIGENEAPLGYALVTGASRGIGRALAVELARYEIPLILVARNMGKLKLLADELVSCYGVPCCVLQADLSQPDAAAKVYRATKDAGLKVDILVNNAGICTHGEHVDTPLEDIEQMVQINAGSVATLSHLYGKDMKKQRRGRILFVSSVVGAVNAGPRVATYAATKAFEKSLSLSIGKELEQYGCGVSCLMPGAVKGTSFKSASNTDDALCWKIPFYPAIAQDVAHRGVRAMLAGDPEVCPGLLNKVFLRVVTPMLPQRLTTLIVETAWNPLRLPWKQPPPRESTVVEEKATASKPASSRPFASFWEPSSERPRVLTTPTETQPSKPLENGVDDDTLEADDNYFEILGVGDEEKAVVRDEESSASEENGDALEKQADTGEMMRDSQADDETPVEQEKSEALPSGDPMVGVLAGEIEAGLVDIIPPPAEDRITEDVNTETCETPGLEEKSEISALADDIEAEVMKLVPVPKEDEPADSQTPPDDKERSESPKSVIQEKDLDLLLHVD